MSRQNFYQQRKRRECRQVDEEKVVKWVRQERQLQPKLGTRKLHTRIQQRLKAERISLGRDRLFDLMRRHHLLIRRRRRTVKTTQSSHRFRRFPNKIKDLQVESVHQVWVSDLTYLRIKGGFVYLSLVMDTYSRKIIGYHVNNSLEAEGCVKSLRQALRQLPDKHRPIHHSDRGIQYSCNEYTGLLARHKLSISMTEDNHCYENARAERVIGTLKHEYALAGTLPDKKAARRAVDQAVYLYNESRPHMALDMDTPAQVHSQAA